MTAPQCPPQADPDTPWRTRAACRGHDPNIWFPNKGDDATRQQALRICRECPVKRACGQTAHDELIPYGIWGGMTEKQRSTASGTTTGQRTALLLAGAHLKPCGTQAAYMRHLRNGEKPCDACTAANRRATDHSRANA